MLVTSPNLCRWSVHQILLPPSTSVPNTIIYNTLPQTQHLIHSTTPISLLLSCCYAATVTTTNKRINKAIIFLPSSLSLLLFLSSCTHTLTRLITHSCQSSHKHALALTVLYPPFTLLACLLSLLAATMQSLLSTIGDFLKSVAIASIASICGLAATRLWSTLRLRKGKKRAASPPRSCLSSSDPLDWPRKPRKQVRLVTENIIRHTYTPVVAKFVTFHWRGPLCIEFDHESDPAGYNTLHCRKTLWVRGKPEIEDLVDDDGDIGMGDF